MQKASPVCPSSEKNLDLSVEAAHDAERAEAHHSDKKQAGSKYLVHRALGSQCRQNRTDEGKHPDDSAKDLHLKTSLKPHQCVPIVCLLKIADR